MKIVIDFDEATQQVVSVMVGDSIQTPTVKTKKPKAADDKEMVTLESNKLILTAKLAEFLKAKEGDKLIVRYKQDGEFIEPFLGPPKAFNEEEGNKLTKALTISFRGDQNQALARFGTTFETLDMGDGTVKLLSTVRVKDVVTEITLEHLNPATNIGDDLILTKNSFEIK